jgi:catechol 2,3-dioxygenase
MAPRLHSLSHVALETPDLDASLSFFREAVGLEEVERADGTVYLRAVDEFCHHSLSLTGADAAGVDHVAWQAADAESVDGFAERLEAAGVDVAEVDADEEPGQGAGIRFGTPTGHRLEVFYGMASPDVPTDRRSRLKNKPYAATTTTPIAPRRIDHVQVWDADALALAAWLAEHLDLRVQEYYDLTDGSRWGTFMSASGVKIEIAVIQDDDPDGPAALNHVAYKVDRGDDLFDAADAMRERGIPTDGFGQHSISRGKFLYARDPASDHTVEFSAGGYLVFDPEWEPIAWSADDLEDRQWVGRLVGGPNVSY